MRRGGEVGDQARRRSLGDAAATSGTSAWWCGSARSRHLSSGRDVWPPDPVAELMTIAESIDAWTATDRIAFRFEGETISYADLHRRVERAAAGLIAAGIEPGDRIGFCGLNRVEVFELLLACSRVGAIFVPFNNRLTAPELGVQIRDCCPAIIFTTDSFGSLISQAAPDQPTRDLDAAPFADQRLMLDDYGHGPETTLLMVYTSGTTGQPKGAMLSQDALLFTSLNGIDQQGLGIDDRIIAPLPTFHVGGLNIQTIPTLMVGGEVVLQRRFDPGEFLELIEQHRITQTVLVPAMLTAVAAEPNFAATDLSSLRGINSGSSVVPIEVMRPYFERGVPVGQVYGTTETGPSAVGLGYDEAERRAGSCGRALAHTELRVVDSTGNDLDDLEQGELWLRGPNVFTAYWGDVQATAQAFAPGGWFRTGDVGYRDAEGYVYVSDRIKDVVISGGENIYPAEIEPVLAEHPAIAEVTVVGQADDRWGEVPVAVVVLVEGASLDLADLREWCDGRLARFKHPRRLRIVDEFPRTALGKVKKHELRR